MIGVTGIIWEKDFIFIRDYNSYAGRWVGRKGSVYGQPVHKLSWKSVHRQTNKR